MTDRRAAWSRTKRNLRAMRGFLFLDYGSIRDELNSRKFQRGRAPGGAELRRIQRTGRHATKLQRGRAPGGAELRTLPRPVRAEVARFNGAAPRGARN